MSDIRMQLYMRIYVFANRVKFYYNTSHYYRDLDIMCYVFIHSPIQHLFTEHLLYARDYSKSQEYSVTNLTKFLTFLELILPLIKNTISWSLLKRLAYKIYAYHVITLVSFFIRKVGFVFREILQGKMKCFKS